MTNAEKTFRAKAPGIMRKLMSDFPFSAEDAAAVVGNLGHECAGFTQFQELKPVVPGSRGGFGWAQWTGPRRREYEAYCARNGLHPASDKANYAFLFVELTGSEKKAVPAVKAAKTLDEKVVAFEKAFLRAGVKHYPSRKKYARWAMEEFGKAKFPKPSLPLPGPAPVNRTPPKGSLVAFLVALASLLGGIVAKIMGVF